ncbi:MFSD8 protein, partial [Pseudoatta argentina]
MIYFTMFLMSLGFSIILTGVWPYLGKLDPTTGKEFMGYIVAANPLGQMLFSPLVGWWGNKRGSVRLPLLITLALFTISSAAYSILEMIPGNKKNYMLVARFFVGVSSGKFFSNFYIVLGFVVGPGLQAAVTPLGDHGVTFLMLPLNMYTAAGWINLLQIYLFSCSLGTSLTMDQFAWTKKEALYYMGILMSVGAVIACITFTMIGPLCKKFAERKVMLWGGFFFMVIGRVLCIPWGPDSPIIGDFGPYNNITTDANGTEIVGCPITQEWCLYTPQITITQFLIGYAFTSVGYPIGVTLMQTIFSKILGPRPQGVWMGLMTGAGCASRVLGPIFVGFIYTRLGTYHTFGITGVMLIISMLWLQFVNKRLIAPELKKSNEVSNKQEKDIEIPLVQLRSNNTQTSRENV